MLYAMLGWSEMVIVTESQLSLPRGISIEMDISFISNFKQLSYHRVKITIVPIYFVLHTTNTDM